MKGFLKYLWFNFLLGLCIVLAIGIFVGLIVFINNPWVCGICIFLYIVILASIITYKESKE